MPILPVYYVYLIKLPAIPCCGAASPDAVSCAADAATSYSVRQGDVYSPEVSLRDLSFDGELRRGFLSRGLGQLSDGMLGGDSFLEDRGYGKGESGIAMLGSRNGGCWMTGAAAGQGSR